MDRRDLAALSWSHKTLVPKDADEVAVRRFGYGSTQLEYARLGVDYVEKAKDLVLEMEKVHNTVIFYGTRRGSKRDPLIEVAHDGPGMVDEASGQRWDDPRTTLKRLVDRLQASQDDGVDVPVSEIVALMKDIKERARSKP